MKQTKWLINLSVLLALLAITVGAKNLSPSRSSFQDAGDASPDTLTVPDTIALPFASYLMGAVVDSIQLPASDSCVNEYARCIISLLLSILCVRERYGYHDCAAGRFAYTGRTL